MREKQKSLAELQHSRLRFHPERSEHSNPEERNKTDWQMHGEGTERRVSLPVVRDRPEAEDRTPHMRIPKPKSSRYVRWLDP